MFEIPEIEATGRVAEIYDDIRQTLDMSMVNTIWRSLALKEEVLEWVWSSLKPIYQNGSVRHYASKLHSQINLDNVPPIPLPALRILGVSDKDKDDLKNLMDDLAYSNAQNIIAGSDQRVPMGNYRKQFKSLVARGWFEQKYNRLGRFNICSICF